MNCTYSNNDLNPYLSVGCDMRGGIKSTMNALSGKIGQYKTQVLKVDQGYIPPRAPGRV